MNGILAFYYINASQYANIATPDEDALYFISDTYNLYKGSNLYSGGVKLVATLPTTPALGTLYILTTTWVGQVWTGTAWKIITKPFTDEINATTGASNETVPTTKAVYDYVGNAVSQSTNGAITNITYTASSGNLTLKTANNSSSNLLLNGMVHNATYNSTSRVVNLPIAGGSNVTFTIPKDQDLVVKAGKYNADTEEIWLSIDPTGAYTNASNVIKIPVSGLIDEIEVGNTNTITMDYDVTNNTITANVKISEVANNALVDNSGLYIDISSKLDVSRVSTATDLANAGANDLLTKSLIKAYVDAQINNTTNTINSVNTTLNSKISNAESNITSVRNTVNSHTNSIANNASNISNNASNISNLSNLLTWKTTS